MHPVFSIGVLIVFAIGVAISLFVQLTRWPAAILCRWSLGPPEGHGWMYLQVVSRGGTPLYSARFCTRCGRLQKGETAESVVDFALRMLHADQDEVARRYRAQPRKDGDGDGAERLSRSVGEPDGSAGVRP